MVGNSRLRGGFLLLALSAGVALAGCTPAVEEGPGTLAPAVYEARRERIVDFFAERLAGRDVVATTRTPSGQVIDWVERESQSASGEIALPPADEPGDAAMPERHDANPFLETALPQRLAALGLKEERALTELQLDGVELGPPGTVPIVRFDVDAYLAATRLLPEDPLEILTKVPPPAPAANDRYYAVWHRFGDVFGSAGRVNIWDTAGPIGNETSIAQVAVIRGSPMQAIEAGKIEHAAFAPAKRPVLFTYFRTSGGASGDWVGGYNALVDGWIQYSSTVAPGLSLEPWESTTDGSQYSLDVTVRLWEGNWWVWAAGQWAGYYPFCKGGDAPPCDEAPLFATGGLRDKADRLDWYGEVFDSSAPAATSSDMGSGAFADRRWQEAAYFRNLTFFWQPNTYWWWDAGSISVTDAQCYSGDGPYYSSDPNWRNWFYHGGPGKEAAACS